MSREGKRGRARGVARGGLAWARAGEAVVAGGKLAGDAVVAGSKKAGGAVAHGAVVAGEAGASMVERIFCGNWVGGGGGAGGACIDGQACGGGAPLGKAPLVAAPSLLLLLDAPRLPTPVAR